MSHLGPDLIAIAWPPPPQKDDSKEQVASHPATGHSPQYPGLPSCAFLLRIKTKVLTGGTNQSDLKIGDNIVVARPVS